VRTKAGWQAAGSGFQTFTGTGHTKGGGSRLGHVAPGTLEARSEARDARDGWGSPTYGLGRNNEP
jgi:hypothetical protein